MQETFRIGESYTVEPALNRVTGPNGATRLEPKVMQVLVCLAERAGQVVSKERLLHSAWADTSVGDDVLTRAISELRRLFEDAPKQPRVIETIPKAGYRLIAPVTGSKPEPTRPAAPEARTEALPRMIPPRRRARSGLAVFLGTFFLVAAGIAAWYMRPPHHSYNRSPNVIPLTVLPGHEVWPSFSPGGDQVAFEWDGEHGENADIYIKMVGSPEVRRLTSDAGPDSAPAWSPDGRRIAYIHREPDSGGRIHLVSPLGGSNQTLSDVAAAPPLTWSPDGRYLAAARIGSPEGIYLIPLDGGVPRVIVRSKPPRADAAPAFSPDGHWLAYRSCEAAMIRCDVYVAALDETLAPTSAPRRLTRATAYIVGSLAWSRDGRSIVYNSLAPLFTYLWRVGVDGQQPEERVEVAGLGAAMPATARTRDRLAFVRIDVDTDVFRFRVGSPSQPAVASSFLEAESRFSPDGRRVAFASMRSGDTFRIWVAGADGSDPQQFTRGPGVEEGSPWWSPDGRRIAFDSRTNDWHSHIWIMDADGGGLRQLTTAPGDQNVPCWSRDGRTIYFSADQGTGRDIWRVAVTGGPPERLTRGGSGEFACESPDAKSLLYQPRDQDSPLLALPFGGGPVRQIVACVRRTAFLGGSHGVFYVACDPGTDPELHVLDATDGRDRLLGRLEGYDFQFPPLGLAVSPDGTSVLYTRRMRDSFDLMLVDNFR